MRIPKKLKGLINNPYNRVKFDTINSLKKYLQTNKDLWDALIRNNIIKIDNNYLYVNPKHYKSEKFAIQSVYELFE